LSEKCGLSANPSAPSACSWPSEAHVTPGLRRRGGQEGHSSLQIERDTEAEHLGGIPGQGGVQRLYIPKVFDPRGKDSLHPIANPGLAMVPAFLGGTQRTIPIRFIQNAAIDIRGA